MRMGYLATLAAASLGLAACGKPADPTAAASTEPLHPAAQTADANGPSAVPEPSPSNAPAATAAAADPLSVRLDCLRQSGGVLLIGHRGGPSRDYPENAVETFEHSFHAGTHGMEIDIAETKDRVLVLMHDDTLDKTTTGHGPVADATWADLQNLTLRTYSRVTGYPPSSLEAALRFAVANHALLELDKKPTASWTPIIADVRKFKAENNVFLVTYTDEQAFEVHKLAPDLIISVTIKSDAQLGALIAKGLKPDHLVAWTGNETPDPALWKAISARGVEPEFGTLGGKDSLDNSYWSDGDGSEFTNLVDHDKLPILVTGLTDKVSRQLSKQIEKARACGF